MNSTAQAHVNIETPEPDFVGQVLIVPSNVNEVEQPILAEQQKAATKVKGGFYAKAKGYNYVTGANSPVKIFENRMIQLIVRASDNERTPLSVINIFKLDSNEKENVRVLLYNSGGTFSATKTEVDFIPFTAEKYGYKSYIISFPHSLSPGEYAVTIDTQREIFNLFSIKSID